MRTYLSRWLELAGKSSTFEGLQDLILMEQLLDGLSVETATFVRERAPGSVGEAATLAQQFFEARRQVRHPIAPQLSVRPSGPRERAAPAQAPGRSQGRQQCFHCGQDGHTRRDCPRERETRPRAGEPPTARVATIRTVNATGGQRSPLCSECAEKVMTSSFRKAVWVNDIPATALRDTGADLLCIRSDLVPNPRLTGSSRWIRYANSGLTRAPLAIIQLESPYYRGKAEAALIPKLVEEVIIGNTLRTELGVELQVPVYGESPGTCAPVQTRAQRAREDDVGVPVKGVVEMLGVGPEEIARMQEQDESLQRIRRLAGERQPPSRHGTGSVSFVQRKGLLWRIYAQRKGAEFKQLVVPQPLRREVLRVAHDKPMAGHLGARRTRDRIWCEFYWPGMCKEIGRYCASCDTCQRTTPRGNLRKVPLGKMPIVDQPFKKVGIDLIGDAAVYQW
ncbi:uncharacterized protein LOC112576003 [Pomacea canaliculata]|uniref:uncharacterized protein LOC112576003 n=1 Tax=Pomacea canaliculata TaxID=400727 RepID=UPI000D7307DB|nr:uncharacterized protein LOC112576003 [Pomacea canaliculata]